MNVPLFLGIAENLADISEGGVSLTEAYCLVPVGFKGLRGTQVMLAFMLRFSHGVTGSVGRPALDMAVKSLIDGGDRWTERQTDGKTF